MRVPALPVLAAPALLVGCRTISLPEFAAAARRADVRCVAVEPDVTLVSPFGPERTAVFLGHVQGSLGALEALLEVDVPASLVVVLEPLEVPLELRAEGDDLHVRGAVPGHRSGVLGFASTRGDSPAVLVYVSPDQRLVLPDGKQVTFTFDLGNEGTIRHELAHVCAGLAGLQGPTWYDEGLALELEYREPGAHGALEPVALPETLRLAREAAPAFSVGDVLAWEEDGSAVHAGRQEAFQEGRPLAHALMRFLLERTEGLERSEGAGLRARLERIRDLPPEHLRALDDEWHAWLAALPGE